MQSKNLVYKEYAQDEDCKWLISNLVSNLNAKTLDHYIATRGEQDLSVEMINGKKKYNFPKCTVEDFADQLDSNKLIKLHNPRLEFNENCTISKLYTIDIIDKESLKEVLCMFETEITYESYGVSKQVKMFENLLKKKFGELENDKFIIKHSDFFTPRHFLFLTTLFRYEKENYLTVNSVDAKLDKYDCRSDAHICLENKIFKKWSFTYLSPSNYVKFDVKSGILRVENKDYKFSEPENIESNLMELMIKNINCRVTHKDIARITWGYSKQDNLDEKYAKNKSEMNNKNKVRIYDLKKKIRKFSLDSKLQFKPCNGYMLEYHVPDRIDEDIKMIIAESIGEIKF